MTWRRLVVLPPAAYHLMLTITKTWAGQANGGGLRFVVEATTEPNFAFWAS